MTNIFLFAIAAMSLAAVQPVLAQDLTASDQPVRILACKLLTTHAGGGTVQIAFVNRSVQTATEVTFLVGAQPISFRGQFLNGKPVGHTFGPYDAVGGHDICAVSSVTFDDGRMWQRL
ncbi:MAG: hypothetical protein JWN27_3193 [Candidatus Eremiobacteraeota bacterium]|nr:hypothetical protein [Candidatus Eremiobacteraeota bacterium]